MQCELCLKEITIITDEIIDSETGIFCRACVDELIADGRYKSVEDFQGFDD